MSYWLIKSEADVYSIDNLRSDRKTAWTGVRNYQARNYLRQMQVGEPVLFYHSNSKPLAVVGLAVVSKTAFPDSLQFDPDSEYYDPGASAENPRWYSPELRFKNKFAQPVTRENLLGSAALKNMLLLSKGSRLSVQPVTDKEFNTVLQLAGQTLEISARS